jgi:hypothetical protein
MLRWFRSTLEWVARGPEERSGAVTGGQVWRSRSGSGTLEGAQDSPLESPGRLRHHCDPAFQGMGDIGGARTGGP